MTDLRIPVGGGIEDELDSLSLPTIVPVWPPRGEFLDDPRDDIALPYGVVHGRLHVPANFEGL